jgi:hypothetical protein
VKPFGYGDFGYRMREKVGRGPCLSYEDTRHGANEHSNYSTMSEYDLGRFPGDCHLGFPHNPPKRPLPAFNPAPPSPPLLASVLIHSFNHSRSLINFESITFVPVCASPRSKLNRVGKLVIIYVIANPLSIMSCESNSISANETPPSASPTPDEISSWRTGERVRHVLQ